LVTYQNYTKMRGPKSIKFCWVMFVVLKQIAHVVLQLGEVSCYGLSESQTPLQQHLFVPRHSWDVGMGSQTASTASLHCSVICSHSYSTSCSAYARRPASDSTYAMPDTATFNFVHSILLPTLCTYLIKNYHNSHLKPHTLKMSVMHNSKLKPNMFRSQSSDHHQGSITVLVQLLVIGVHASSYSSMWLYVVCASVHTMYLSVWCLVNYASQTFLTCGVLTL